MMGLLLRLTGGSRVLSGGIMAVGLALAVLGVFWAGSAWNERGNKIEQLEAVKETGDRINEAISDGTGVPWRDRIGGMHDADD